MGREISKYTKSLCSYILTIPENEEKEKIKFILENQNEEFSNSKNEQLSFLTNQELTKWEFEKETTISGVSFKVFKIAHSIEKNEKIYLPFNEKWESKFYDDYFVIKEGYSYYCELKDKKFIFFNLNHKIASMILKRTLKKNDYFKKMPVDFQRIISFKETESFINEIEGFWAEILSDSIRTIGGFGVDVSNSELFERNVNRLKALYFNYIAKDGSKFERLLLSNHGVLVVKEQLTIDDLVKLYLELIERGFFAI